MRSPSDSLAHGTASPMPLDELCDDDAVERRASSAAVAVDAAAAGAADAKTEEHLKQ